MEVLVVVGLLALVGVTIALLALARVFHLHFNQDLAPQAAPEPVPDRLVTDDLQRQIDRLTLAVSDGIERVARAESRVSKTVTSARRLLKDSGLEHAGIEAEAEEIRGRDESPSEETPVQGVLPILADDRPSGVPGMTNDHLARLQSEVANRAG